MSEKDPALVEWARRLKIVVGAVTLSLALGAVAWAWATKDIRDAQMVERQQRIEADASRDARVDRLVTLVELMAILEVEPKGSPERAEALVKLRSLRHVLQ